jgi:hypothetical protein
VNLDPFRFPLFGMELGAFDTAGADTAVNASMRLTDPPSNSSTLTAIGLPVFGSTPLERNVDLWVGRNISGKFSL